MGYLSCGATTIRLQVQGCKAVQVQGCKAVQVQGCIAVQVQGCIAVQVQGCIAVGSYRAMDRACGEAAGVK